MKDAPNFLIKPLQIPLNDNACNVYNTRRLKVHARKEMRKYTLSVLQNDS